MYVFKLLSMKRKSGWRQNERTPDSHTSLGIQVNGAGDSCGSGGGGCGGSDGGSGGSSGGGSDGGSGGGSGSMVTMVKRSRAVVDVTWSTVVVYTSWSQWSN